MTERPILFSAAMVQALLAGAKTCTRRVVKLKPWHQIEERDDGSPWPWMHDADRVADYWLPCPYGKPGERLYVREGFSYAHGQGLADRGPVWWWADGAPQLGDWSRPKPSIHMPRWASRITLEVKAVRVERLHDINRGGAMDEGCPFQNMAKGPDPRQWFTDLWSQINGPESWSANPWVWRVDFRRVQ